MMTEDVKNAATQAWLDYGEAIKQVIRLKGFIEAKPLLHILQNEDEEIVKSFTQYIKNQTKILRRVW